MSVGRTKTLRRVKPPASAREAYDRWGLDKSGDKVLKARQPAYTAEHYEADVDSGTIAAGIRACPRHRPERDCPTAKPGPRRRGESHVASPAVTNSSWTAYAIVGRWTIDGERPMRRALLKQHPICLDCRLYLYWSDRQAAFRELGFDHGLGTVRASAGLRELWARQAAAEVERTIQLEIESRAELELDGINIVAHVGDDDESVIDDTFDEIRDRVHDDGRISTYLESIRAGEQLYARERSDLIALAGDPFEDEPGFPTVPGLLADRFELATLLSIVRHCITCNLAARLDLPQPKPRVRLMS